MISADTTRDTAMSKGEGIPIAQAVISAVTYDLIGYRWDNLKFQCRIQATLTPALDTKFLVKRGIRVGSTDYTVDIGYFYISSCFTAPNGITYLSAHALPTRGVTNIAAYTPLDDILTAIGTEISATFTGPNKAWFNTWQFYASTEGGIGFTSTRIIENVVMQKRRAMMFQRQSSITLFCPNADSATFTPTAYTPPEFVQAITPALKDLYLHCYDENTFQRSVLTGTATTNSPSTNLGFIPASVALTDVDDHGVDGGGALSWTQLPDLRLEQGEPVTINGYSGTRYLAFVEFFNWSGNPAWRQVVRDVQWQTSSGAGYGELPIQNVTNITQIQNTFFQDIVYNITQEITQNFVDYITNYNGYFATNVLVDVNNFRYLLTEAIPADPGITLVSLQSVLEIIDQHLHGGAEWLSYQNFQ